MQIFQRRKKKNKTFSQQNDFKPRSFKLDCILSRFKTAISYRKDFNLTKFLNTILNFLFILPAWIFRRLLSVNRIDKNWVRNKAKCAWKQTSKRGIKESAVLLNKSVRWQVQNKTKFDKERDFLEEGQTYSRLNFR